MSSSKSHLMAAAFCFSTLTFGTTDSYAVTLDFETLPNGTPTTSLALVGTSYQSLGVVFSSEGELDTTRNPNFYPDIGDPSNQLVADFAHDAASTFNIRADFLNGTSVVSADTTTAAASMAMSAFDASGSFLGSAMGNAYTYGTFQFLSLSGIGTISYVIWETSSPTGAGPLIDNLTFDATVVPLPAALPLFAGGLGLLGWMARRKRRQAAHA